LDFRLNLSGGRSRLPGHFAAGAGKRKKIALSKNDTRIKRR
jgi:hypothetical protein